MNWLQYQNQSATRNKPLSPNLVQALSFLPDMGVEMRVISGGQDAKGQGNRRTGSTRHDHGEAADADFYMDGRKLDWNNPNDVPIFTDIVKRARANGVTGIGAGDDYMGAGRMHIGFGNEAVWGAGGSSANAPAWLKTAFHGEPGHVHVPGDEQQGSDDTLLGGLSLTPDRMGAPPILDMMEAPAMEPQKATGILGSLFGDMTQERADQIRLGVNGMLHNPNRGLERQVQGRMDDRRDTRKANTAAQQAAQQANKTAAWLATQPGGEQFAQAVSTGALPAGQALQMWQAQSKGPDQTALMQQYSLAQQQGYDGSFMDYQIDLKKAGASNSTVTVNNSDGNPMLGTIPQGYEAVRDPDTGAFTMRPVPGGPEDNSAKEALADEGKRRSGDVVIEDIDRVISKMDDGGLPVAGMGGGILSNIPGTDAHDASKLINTIKANVGFDRLQQMRDSSPTGGALGAINQSEMTLLNSALGSLEQSQSPEQFKENLTRLKGIYAEIVHGAGGSEAAPKAGEANTTAPDFSAMSDAELDAYIESGGR